MSTMNIDDSATTYDDREILARIRSAQMYDTMHNDYKRTQRFQGVAFTFLQLSDQRKRQVERSELKFGYEIVGLVDLRPHVWTIARAMTSARVPDYIAVPDARQAYEAAAKYVQVYTACRTMLMEYEDGEHTAMSFLSMWSSDSLAALRDVSTKTMGSAVDGIVYSLLLLASRHKFGPTEYNNSLQQLREKMDIPVKAYPLYLGVRVRKEDIMAPIPY